ncbi:MULTISPECIES: SET domain-containing protein [Aequorivita]|uniref:SET domain-containing protein n=1 Tax=Aequorivita iocasae TaxID=2803865 RepID=A0ABX7DNK4_9FLAO|nr:MULTISPECIES: SET domain-containing protein [Aequorivita]QQX75690.1 SET domain-containing protein [Aequorivita iocasae]UCA55147.1 SET domain-containing protein [Aequorivita sp. F7]
MIHPKTELKFISDKIGYGVVATEFIPAGTITWALDDLDREFTPAKMKKMNSLYQNILETYCYRNNKGNFVLCWDYGRYVNHSFKSNCLSTAYDFEIAIRDIQAGEELTDDYGYLNVSEPFNGIEEGTKRKTVYPDDLLNFHQVWDEQLIKNFPAILNVEQPLKSLITPKLWSTITAIAEGKKEMDSILKNHFPG